MGDVLGGKQLVFIGFNPRRAERPRDAPLGTPALATHVGRGTVEKTLANPLSLRPVRVVVHLVRAGQPLDLQLNID
ncbi:MAG TPA: hypothetical protein VHB79_27535 [Polyangiaceae bacterium]|nr:hypothetical protein [Polyangiaceae bacterium]